MLGAAASVSAVWEWVGVAMWVWLCTCLCRCLDVEQSKASALFCTCDLTGARYMGVVHAPSNQLWIVSDGDFTEGDSPAGGVVVKVEGTHVSSFPKLGVMLVLDPQQGLTLYSGSQKVMCMYVCMYVN